MRFARLHDRHEDKTVAIVGATCSLEASEEFCCINKRIVNVTMVLVGDQPAVYRL